MLRSNYIEHGRNNRRPRVRLYALAAVAWLITVPVTGPPFETSNPEARTVSGDKTITVVFRYDDYPERKSSEVDANVIAAFQRSHLTCTFAVVPYKCQGEFADTTPQENTPLTPAEVSQLKQAVKAGAVDVALHGFSHQKTHGAWRSWSSEFRSVDYTSQRVRLDTGKKYLEKMLQIPITTFVPPWNTYDENTLLALERLGFECLSGGPAGCVPASTTLQFLPSTCNAANLRTIIERERAAPTAQPIIVVLFHPYDFREFDPKRGLFSHEQFAELLRWVGSQEDVRVLSVGAAVRQIGNLSADRFREYSQYSRASRVLPFAPSFLRFPQPQLYGSGEELARVTPERWTVAALAYSALFLLCAAVWYGIARLALVRRFVALVKVARVGGLALLPLVIFYALRDGSLSWSAVSVVTLLLGVCTGLWSSSFAPSGRRPRLSFSKTQAGVQVPA